MMHVSWATRYDDAVFEKCMAESWLEGARYYYSRYYNFDEKSQEEWDLVHKWEQRVKDTTPEELRTGCHLILEDAGFMGEDVYILNGDIQHAIHCKHTVCGAYAVLFPSREIGQWCGKCNRAIPEEEVKHWNDVDPPEDFGECGTTP
jgi:hypothetical protein